MFLLRLPVLVSLLAPASAPATTPDLCGGSGGGTFVGKMDDRFDVRVNLFCADGERMMGTLSQVGAGNLNSFVVNLCGAEVDGDDLVVAPFSKDPTDHRGKASANAYNYLRVSLKDFRAGKLTGYFVANTGNAFHKISAKQEKTFPRRPDAAAPSAEASRDPDPRGLYEVTGTPLGKARLLFDVVHGMPIGTFTYADAETIHLTNGPHLGPRNSFALNNIGGDCGEPASRKLFLFSGQFPQPDEIEISWISPREGLLGPFRGKRIAKP